MTTVVYSARARKDLLRVADFLAEEDAKWAEELPGLIVGAINILERHPLMGRPVPGSMRRELVISRGRSGYLALYDYDPSNDVVTVQAVRHQRESGFDEP